MKQNKLLVGLQHRLIDLIGESVEIFVQARPWLLQIDINTWEMVQMLHGVQKPKPYPFKTEQQIEEWKKQNNLEIERVLSAIESIYNLQEHNDFFKVKQTSLFEQEVNFGPETSEEWFARRYWEESEAEYNAVLLILDK